LPRTNFHTLQYSPVSQKFWGRLPLNGAFSYLFFKKGNATQALLHALKYQGRQDVGEKLGAMFSKELATSGRYDAELIIPLPLHESKQRARGYNQCDSIARGMQRYLGCESDTNSVKRLVANTTQTRKSRIDRWSNVETIFAVTQPEKIAGKSVLLIDDVVTTGATLEACGRTILEAGARSLSIATLATA
jgi:ComF family protein